MKVIEDSAEWQDLLNRIARSDKKLTSLNLTNNSNLSYSVIRQLAHVLQDNQFVTSIDLGYCSINDVNISTLAYFLRGNQSIATLGLAANNIGDSGAKSLAQFLMINKTVKSLDLSHNKIGDEGATEIGFALKNGASLKKLLLRSEGIGEKGAIAIASGLINNSKLDELDLRGDEIGDEGILAIASVIKTNRTLKYLCLSCKKVSISGVKLIAQALRVNQTLIEFAFVNSNINSFSVALLADALIDNSTLKDFDVSGNRIRNEGAKRLISVLMEHSSISSLGLSACGIGDDGMREIAGFLRKNQLLIRIKLRDNDISDLGFQSIVDALFINQSLIALSIFSFDKFLSTIERSHKIATRIYSNSMRRRNCYNAVYEGDLTELMDAVEAGVSLLTPNMRVFTDLESEGHLIEDHSLLSGDKSNTLLHVAVEANQPEIVRYLIRKMKEKNLLLTTRNSKGQTASELAKNPAIAMLFDESTTSPEKAKALWQYDRKGSDFLNQPLQLTNISTNSNSFSNKTSVETINSHIRAIEAAANQIKQQFLGLLQADYQKLLSEYQKLGRQQFERDAQIQQQRFASYLKDEEQRLQKSTKACQADFQSKLAEVLSPYQEMSNTTMSQATLNQIGQQLKIKLEQSMSGKLKRVMDSQSY